MIVDTEVAPGCAGILTIGDLEVPPGEVAPPLRR